MTDDNDAEQPPLVATQPIAGPLPEGAVGIDVGLTLTKVVRGTPSGLEFSAHPTSDASELLASVTRSPSSPEILGITGARAGMVDAPEYARHVQEIDAAARGATPLSSAEAREPQDPFVLALLGTGTAFALVRDGRVTHLGGTALGGGSFAGIASRIDPSLDYKSMIEGAARGDRRKADLMISDAYAEGIGRIGPDLTAAHLARHDGSIDDVLAALLNLHGESIGQIAASRARIAGASQVVVAGGFVGMTAVDNPLLVTSLTQMIGMFGVAADVANMPAFVGAIGAALIAAEAHAKEHQ